MFKRVRIDRDIFAIRAPKCLHSHFIDGALKLFLYPKFVWLLKVMTFFSKIWSLFGMHW